MSSGSRVVSAAALALAVGTGVALACDDQVALLGDPVVNGFIAGGSASVRAG